MATRAERTALAFLTSVVLVGAAVRVTRALRHQSAPEPAAAKALARQRKAVDSAAHMHRPSRGGTAAEGPTSSRSSRGARPRAAVPAAAPVPVDVDHASARELEALPRVGAALAARIVAEREAKGPFGSLDRLRARVKGIGPAMVKTLEPLVVFSSR